MFLAAIDPNVTNLIQAVSAVIQVIASLTLIGITFWYAKLTSGQLRAATAPHVIVYAKHDESRPTLVLIVIENIGKGLARNVRFTLSDRVPKDAYGVTEEAAAATEVWEEGPLITGIPALGPGDHRTMNWGQYFGLKNTLNGKQIRVTCHFSDGVKELGPVECVLEVESMAYIDAVDHDGSRQSAKVLNKIEAHLSKLVKDQFGHGY